MVKRNFYNKFDSGQAFLGSIILPYVVAILLSCFSLFVSLFFPSFMQSTLYGVLLSLSSQVAFILVFLAVNKLNKISVKPALNFSFKVKPVNVVLTIFITIVLFFGLNGFISLFDYLFEWLGYSQSGELPFAINSFGTFILGTLVFCVAPAICEELLFRGVILKGFQKKYGNKLAIVFSALLFSLMHTSPLQTIYPFILGLVMGLIVVKTGNIFYSMLLHFINNFIVVLISYLGTTSYVATSLNFWLVFVYIALALFALLDIIMLIFLMQPQNKYKQAEIEDQ